MVVEWIFRNYIIDIFQDSTFYEEVCILVNIRSADFDPFLWKNSFFKGLLNIIDIWNSTLLFIQINLLRVKQIDDLSVTTRTFKKRGFYLTGDVQFFPICFFSVNHPVKKHLPLKFVTFMWDPGQLKKFREAALAISENL